MKSISLAQPDQLARSAQFYFSISMFNLKSKSINAGLTERGVKVWIEFALREFAKVKSIFRSLKVKLNLKIRLFIAACISILV